MVRTVAYPDDPALYERLVSKVEIDGNGCWLWQKRLDRHGYPIYAMRCGGRKSRCWMAHRLMAKLRLAEWSQELWTCHHCDVRSCINPEHLFMGTQRDNLHDARQKGHLPWTKLTEENVRAIMADVRGQRLVARDYGVGRETVRAIRQGMYWNHITGLPLKRRAPR